MQVIDEREITIESNWFSPERDVTRTKGLHLSHIISYIEHLAGKKHTRDLSESDGNAYQTEGFLWERVLERLIEDRPTELWEWMFGRAASEPYNPKIIRPGEQCLDAGECPLCDGDGKIVRLTGDRPCKPCKGTGRVKVYMTPDGLNLDDGVLEEFKWTSVSSKWPITDKRFSKWVNYQIPSYLKALQLDTCRLRVNFSRGNYTDGVPIWKEWLLRYTQQEIDETWECIAQHAGIMYRDGLVI